MKCNRLNLESLEQRLNLSPFFGFAVGGDTSGASNSQAIATDASGNVYITGYFSGTVHFGATTLTAKGTDDAFVAKYNSSGAVVWADDLGGASATTEGAGIAVDAAGDVYTTGYFIGSNVNLDPSGDSAHELTSSDNGVNSNAYVSKLNSSGQYIFGLDLGYGGYTFGTAIALDSQGNIYTTGGFSGTSVDFATSYGSNHTLSSSSGGTSTNVYVSKLTSSGQYELAAVLGSSGYAFGNGIAVDASENVYIAGAFEGTNVNFDPNGSNHQLSSSNSGANQNGFISKLTSTGQYVYAVDIGYGGNSAANAIALDGSGDVYTTGGFSGNNVEFDPGSSLHELSSSHSGSDTNAFISKLNSSGQYSFGVDLGYGAYAEGEGIAIDASGNVYSTGGFEGSNQAFDPNSSAHPLSSSNSGAQMNVYVSQLNGSGQYGFAVALGAGSNASGFGVAVDANGDVYTTGHFNGSSANFNPFGTADLSSPSGSEAFFISKLTQYQSQYAYAAFNYTYWAYIDAYDAYATGAGSYTAFLNEFYAEYFAQLAYSYSLTGNASSSENYAYYAYYYGYLGQYDAYQDYVQSGGSSTYSYDAYYYGYYGQVYSYYTYLGE